jgi:hypothetical protein
MDFRSRISRFVRIVFIIARTAAAVSMTAFIKIFAGSP